MTPNLFHWNYKEGAMLYCAIFAIISLLAGAGLFLFLIYDLLMGIKAAQNPSPEKVEAFWATRGGPPQI